MSLNQRIEEWLKDTTKKLDISDLELTEWPKQLICKEYLIKILDCSYNQLTSFPNNLPRLETLNCSHNQLTSLPNDLSEVPEGLPSWPNLKILNCSDNELTSLPNSLTKLEYLYCSCNQLISFPNGLTNLKTLDCSYNKLTSLPNSLIKLETLRCSHNKLTSLPNNLTKLKMLSCYNNKLFADKLEKWEKIWAISIRHQHVLRNAGLKKVIKTLKNRLYLPSLNELREELIWSPNHPGKFFELLPRCGNW